MMSTSLRSARISVNHATVLSVVFRLVTRATPDVLAALRHQREATFALLRPVSADVGVSKVPVTDGLDVMDIDESAEPL